MEWVAVVYGFWNRSWRDCKEGRISVFFHRSNKYKGRSIKPLRWKISSGNNELKGIGFDMVIRIRITFMLGRIKEVDPIFFAQVKISQVLSG
jgi:hypothetical protein